MCLSLLNFLSSHKMRIITPQSEPRAESESWKGTHERERLLLDL